VRTPVLLRRLAAEIPCLFANGAAQFSTRLRRQQHPEAGTQNGTGEQAHHETATTFVFETIVFRHVLLLFVTELSVIIRRGWRIVRTATLHPGVTQ